MMNRNTNNWDKPPPGFEGMTVSQIATLNPSILSPIASPLNSQQARQARRLYVGNIPLAVTELELMEFLNASFSSTPTGIKVAGTSFSTVVAVQVNREKAYAFAEFRTAEEATAGMAFDGLMLHGHALKIRRPNDYRAPVEVPSSLAIPGIISTNVPDGPNKLFIGGLPSVLNEEHVKTVLASFGQLKAFNLVKDPLTGFSRGYAFFEYVDPNVTGMLYKVGLHQCGQDGC
jgi:splicing factor U2AF 65 kDa subunit